MKRQPEHRDFLEKLNHDRTLQDQLQTVHEAIRTFYPFIDRIAIALSDNDTEIFKTFLSSSGKDIPLTRYESSIDAAPSLQKILEDGKPRVINDLSIFDDGIHAHTTKIKEQGYRSSYTLPFYDRSQFLGFIFYNSYEQNCFNDDVLNRLDLFGHLISARIVKELANIKTILAALRTANQMVHLKDPETGNHLARMARFSRIIAKELADSGHFDFDDEFIEDMFIYAPLHDVGKIAIPDKILLKPDKLDSQEFATMKTHASRGKWVIDSIIRNFGIDAFTNIDLLRNIALYHHETLDGEGYPDGLKGGDIPIEARIVAVADIFDALTSERPYKAAWSNDKAFAMLQRLSKEKLDRKCVDALYKNREKVEEVQKIFEDDRSEN